MNKKQKRIVKQILITKTNAIAIILNNKRYIKVYKNDNLYLFQTHSHTVNAIDELPNGKIISCSDDKSIHINSIDNNAIKEKNIKKPFDLIKEAHQLSIQHLIVISKNRFISWSNDNKLIIRKCELP